MGVRPWVSLLAPNTHYLRVCVWLFKQAGATEGSESRKKLHLQFQQGHSGQRRMVKLKFVYGNCGLCSIIQKKNKEKLEDVYRKG